MVTIWDAALHSAELMTDDRPASHQPIRVGVVGSGYWGPKVIRNFAGLPTAELAMVCDLAPERLAEVGEQYPATALTRSYAEMLASDVEAIAIATPLGTHYELVKQAILAGKHVLVEKPLTATTRQGTEVVALAADHDRVLMVGHTFLFEPAVEALRDLVQRGALGSIQHVSAQRLNLGPVRHDANALWDLAPHDIAILLEVLGAEPLEVNAHGAAYLQPGVDDVVHMNLRFANDLLAHVHLSWLDPVKVRRMTVVGSQKMAIYDDLATDKLLVFDSGAAIEPAESGRLEPRYRLAEGQAVALAKNDEPLRRQCGYFLDCVREGRQPAPDGRFGLKVVRVLEQATRSMQNAGRREHIAWDSPKPQPAASPRRVATARRAAS